MQNFFSLGYRLRVLLAVSANFPDNPRMYNIHTVGKSAHVNAALEKAMHDPRE